MFSGRFSGSGGQSSVRGRQVSTANPESQILFLVLLVGRAVYGGELISSAGRFVPAEEPVALAEVGKTPEVNGTLDDRVWGKAVKHPISRSWPGGTMVETGAYWQIAADETALYVGVGVPQPKPQFVKPTGEDQWAGDLIEFFLDLGKADQRFQFCASPIGLRYDERAGDQKWNGSWIGKGNVTPKGWTLELRIPLTDLGVTGSPAGQTWRTNLCLINGGAYVEWAGNWGDPAGFAPLFFGDAEGYRAAHQSELILSSPLAYWNQYDRFVPLRVVSRISAEKLDHMDLRVTLRSEKGEERVQALPMPKGDGSGIMLHLVLDGMPAGVHKLTVEVASGGKVLASGALPLVKKEDPPAPPKSSLRGPVALRQTSTSPATVTSWPFVTGVPLPRGGVSDAKNVRLTDSAGKEIPAQFEALAHWSPTRESIKWLRVAFNAPSVAGRSARYRLAFGEGVAAPTVSNPVKVNEDDSKVTVDTGAVAFAVSKRAGGWLMSVRRGGKEVYASGKMDGPYVTDHTGAVFRATLDRNPSVAVEEAGPIRAVIRAESWNLRDKSVGSTRKSPAGERANKTILRYYAYAGQPWIELHWTFIVTVDTDAVRFKDIGLRLTGTGTGHVGLDGGRDIALGDGYLLQKKADFCTVRTETGNGHEVVATGKHAPGWAYVDNFGVFVRDFWQMFPKELEVRQGVITVHAWPGHGEYNEDWFIEPEEEPGPDVPHEQIAGPNGVRIYPRYIQNSEKWHHGPLLDFSYPDWWRNPNMAGTVEKESWLDRFTGCGNRAWESWVLYSKAIALGPVKFHAAGTSRTHEMLLDFGGDGREAAAARRATFDAAPHVWLEDPKWLEETQVFGPVNVEAAKSWSAPQKAGWARVAESSYFGLWTHGNLPEYWAQNGYAAIYRTYAGGGHYGGILTDWLIYMCTGDAEHLRFARAQTSQYRDVHVVHYTTPEFMNLPLESKKSLGCVTLMSPYPWFQGGDGWVSTTQLIYDYYLRGDLRSREVLQYHISPTVRTARGSLDRGCGVVMKQLLDWYAHSWQPEAAAKIEEIVAWIVRSDPTAKVSRSSPTPLNWTNFMPQYVELAKDPTLPLRHREEMVNFIKSWADEDAKGDDFRAYGQGLGPGNLLACSWRETGDTKYLMPFARGIRKQQLPPEKWLVPPPAGGSTGIGGLDATLYSYAVWREAVEKGIVAKLVP